jgi:hypothetical protein
MQMMLPHAIARMLHRSALLLQVILPEAVDQMLIMITETSWQPSDLHQLDSVYSTWDLDGRVTAAGGNRDMAAMLKKWERLEIEDSRASIAVAYKCETMNQCCELVEAIYALRTDLRPVSVCSPRLQQGLNVKEYVTLHTPNG